MATYHFYQKERKKLGKVEKIVTNLTSRSEYVIHIKSLWFNFEKSL